MIENKKIQIAQLARSAFARYENSFVFLLLCLLTFSAHQSALNGFWRFDDGMHLKFVATYAPWQYFFQPSVTVLQSYANVTPYNAYFYDINLALFGMKPRWHYAHLMFVLALTAFSTYRLIRLWQRPQPAFLAATLFLAGLPTLHVAQQLMTGHYATGLLFTVLSLHCFTVGVRSNRYGVTLCGAGFYLLATACKEVFVPLVLVLPFIPAGGYRDRLRAALPYVAVAMFYSVWRSVVLGRLMGGYIANAVSPAEQVGQLLSIPLLLVGWTNGQSIRTFLQSGGGLYFLWLLVVLMLGIRANSRKQVSWPLVCFTLPLVVLPLIPLTATPGLSAADRYLFLPWWTSTTLLATILWSQGDARYGPTFKYLFSGGLIALAFYVQNTEHDRIAPQLAMEDTLYHTVMHTDNNVALLPPPNRDNYRTLLSGARQAEAILMRHPLLPAKFVVDKASLCEYTQQGVSIIEYDKSCGCMQNVTHRLNASLAELVGSEANATPGIPLRVKLNFQPNTLRWELGPAVDGNFWVLFGSSPTKVSAKGSIPYASKEPLRFRVRHDSMDGGIAITPNLVFEITRSTEFVWEGESVVDSPSCSPTAQVSK